MSHIIVQYMYTDYCFYTSKKYRSGCVVICMFFYLCFSHVDSSFENVLNNITSFISRYSSYNPVKWADARAVKNVTRIGKDVVKIGIVYIKNSAMVNVVE